VLLPPDRFLPGKEEFSDQVDAMDLAGVPPPKLTPAAKEGTGTGAPTPLSGGAAVDGVKGQ